ncbi:MAG: hypothetical protein NT031_20895, partial [Planctomycetota bacterium]|nr:hypothetical protein [Planctomycetota bacterium]
HSGVTFVAASGDNGAYSTYPNTNSKTVYYPASSASVLGVGGTYLTVGSGGTWVSETGWGNGTSSGTQGGSGGGVSGQIRKPSYQSSAIVTQSSRRRCVPDVAMDADPNSGVPVIDSWDYDPSTADLHRRSGQGPGRAIRP